MRLKKRAQLLENTKLFIDCMKLDFEYSALSLESIIQKYANDEIYSQLSFLKVCEDEMKKGTDFPIAWKNALATSSLYTKEETGKLMTLGGVLGTSDCNAQINILSIYSDYFEKFRKSSEMMAEKYGETAVFAGVFLGFGMFILLI